MKLGKWRFEPTFWPTLGAIILIAAFARLAVWQWHRAAEKRALTASIEAGAHAPAVDLGILLAQGKLASAPPYRHVSARGHYDPAHQVLISEMIHADRVGYFVLTPFVLDRSGATVLVNRGWIPQQGTKQETGATIVSDAVRTLSGLLGSLPAPGYRLGPGAAGKSWPRVLLYPSHQQLERIYGRALLAPVILLDPDASDGYIRDWHPDPKYGPEMHIGYMFQWSALALTVLVVWLVANLRRVRPEEDIR